MDLATEPLYFASEREKEKGVEKKKYWAGIEYMVGLLTGGNWIIHLASIQFN